MGKEGLKDKGRYLICPQTRPESIFHMLYSTGFIVVYDTDHIEAARQIHTKGFQEGICSQTDAMLLACINRINWRSDRTLATRLYLHKDDNIILRCNNVQLLSAVVHPVTFQNTVAFLLQVICSHILTFVS